MTHVLFCLHPFMCISKHLEQSFTMTNLSISVFWMVEIQTEIMTFKLKQTVRVSRVPAQKSIPECLMSFSPYLDRDFVDNGNRSVDMCQDEFPTLVGSCPGGESDGDPILYFCHQCPAGAFAKGKDCCTVFCGFGMQRIGYHHHRCLSTDEIGDIPVEDGTAVIRKGTGTHCTFPAGFRIKSGEIPQVLFQNLRRFGIGRMHRFEESAEDGVRTRYTSVGDV